MKREHLSAIIGSFFVVVSLLFILNGIYLNNKKTTENAYAAQEKKLTQKMTVFGTIESINASELTLLSGKTTYKIKNTDTTQIYLHLSDIPPHSILALSTVSFTYLKKADRIKAVILPTKQGNYTASSLTVDRPNVVSGFVSKKTATLISIPSLQSIYDIDITPDTLIINEKQSPETVTKITIGKKITVYTDVDISQTNSFVAKYIILLP